MFCVSSYSQPDLDHGGDRLIGWSEVEQTAIKYLMENVLFIFRCSDQWDRGSAGRDLFY